MHGFAQFYEETRHPVYRTVVAVTGDADRSEDVVAEAYVRAYERWPDLVAHPNPLGWVVRTALNHDRSQWRRRRRERHVSVDVAGMPEDIVDPAVISAVSALSRRQREVVACRLVLDLDTATTAQVLGMAPGTVTVHLHRATAHLRKSLAAPTLEEPETTRDLREGNHHGK